MIQFLKKDFLYNFLFLSIILVTGIKLFLIGNGFLNFPDEWRHIASGHVLKHIQNGEFENAIQTIFSTQGRPVDTIIKTIPNSLQYISAKIFDLEYYESDNSYPLFLFNFFIFCLILLVHFKVSNLFLKNQIWSLFSVLVFSCLTNSYMYLRHAFPYDCSLLILYYLLYKVLKITSEDSFTSKKVYFLGFFAFTGYLSYPGYFLFYAMLGLIFFFNNLNFDKSKIITRIKCSAVYVLGSLTCLAIFELISRSVGVSYLESSRELSGTLNQGSFEECFIFLFKYLLEIEKLTGVLLIFGIIFFTYLVFKTLSTKKRINSLQKVFIITAFILLLFAGAGFYFQKVVLSGRVIHQFFPLICTSSAYCLSILFANKRKYKIVILPLSILIIFNFLVQFVEYKNYSYPKDISWHFFKKYYPREFTDVCEMGNSWSIMPITNSELEKFSNQLTDCKLEIVNSCTTYPFDLKTHTKHIKNEDETVLFSGMHYLNYKGYQFETYKIEERREIDSVKLYIEVIKK